MIIDYEGVLSNNQAITATAASTNYIDLGSAKDAGPGEPIELLILVPVAFNTLTSLTVGIQTDTDTGFATALKTHASQTIALASLIIGARFTVQIPREGLQRYLRLYYTVAGSNPTLGKIFAGTGPDIASWYS